MSAKIRGAKGLAGLPKDQLVPFSLTMTITESATVTVTVGQLLDLLAKDGYTDPEGDVALFGVDAIHDHLRERFEVLASEDDNAFTLDD